MRWLLLPMMLVACGPWGRTQRANSVEAYAEFRATYPTTAKAAVAERREEGLRWERALQERDARSYRAYLHAHPQGPHAEEARRELDHAMFREAKDSRALRSYLVHQREGAHVVEAEAALEALAWKDACELGSADAYGSYLLHYPDGDHAAEAAARRDDAVWSSVRERDSIYGYRRYLDKHPLGAHRVEAASRLDALTFHRVRIVVRARSTWRGDGLAMATGFAEPLQDVWVEWLHGQGFARPTEVEVVDLTDVSAPPHPLEAWPVEVGTGLIVVDLDERRGMRLDPYFETVIKGTVTLYASGKERPLTSGWVEARSSAFVPRPSQDALHRDAEVRLVGQLPQSVRVRDFLEPGAEPVAQDAPAPVAPRRPVTPARAPKSKSSLADRLSK